MSQSIKTKAQLKRLPIGHKLTLVNCLMGPCNAPRIIHEVMTNQIVMMLPDGRTSHCYLDLPLEPTEQGFLLRTPEGRIACEYVVE